MTLRLPHMYTREGACKVLTRVERNLISSVNLPAAGQLKAIIFPERLII